MARRERGEVDAKQAAARRAVEYVHAGMTLGLGTGSTAALLIQALGERVSREGLQVIGVPTSSRSREMALELHIPVVPLEEAHDIALTIDGADEVDPVNIFASEDKRMKLSVKDAAKRFIGMYGQKGDK